uniref:Retrotransposon gag domain-containing protein n=2 Tax=Moniliophthora roreri TaxID=221103 RepID=A0A0W0G7D4_MONRR
MFAYVFGSTQALLNILNSPAKVADSSQVLTSLNILLQSVTMLPMPRNKVAPPLNQNTTPLRAHLTAAEESDLNDQIKVAQQLLNPNPSRTPQRITYRQRRRAIESLQELSEHSESDPEAKSSETNPFEEYQAIYHTSTLEMMTPSGSTAPDVKLMVEVDDTDKQWAKTISTTVIETLDEKKKELSKGPVPNPYRGDHKDTRHFLLDLELYFRMNPLKSNTDKKKKMLLSLLKGKTNTWKITEQMKLFPEDNDPEEKKKAAKESWSSFKKRFQAKWQPIDVTEEAQMKIEEVRMKDRADDYVNKFHLIAMETGYDE